MEQIYRIVNGVREDMDSILKMDNAALVMAEYRKHPVLSTAMVTAEKNVQERALLEKYVADQQTQLDRRENQKQQLIAATPELSSVQEERFTVSFAATGSIAALKAMKAYGLSLGITFEEITQEDEKNE